MRPPLTVKDDNTFFNNQIASRAGHLVRIPTSFVKSAIGVLGKTLVSTANLLTLGTDENVREATRTLFDNKAPDIFYKNNDYDNPKTPTKVKFNAAELLTGPYENLLRMINPKAKIATTTTIANLSILNAMIQRIQRLSSSETLLNRHISCRISLVLTAVVLLVAKVALTLASLQFVAISILSLGRSERTNNLAALALRQPPSLIPLIYTLAIGLLNPSYENLKSLNDGL